MKRLFSALMLAVIFLATPQTAQARMKFGKDQQIHRLQSVKLKGSQNEALYLGYMTTTQWFGAGLYIEDNGYVLGVVGNDKKFYRLPKGERLAGFQQRGLLPNPLPKYQLGFFDYLFGYSLWLALAVLAIWGGVSVLRRRRENETLSAHA